MVPPETVIIKGKVVYLSRAFKTIELRASKDGTVEHREEFYDNEPGEIALQDYKAQAGGFSTSVNYKNVGGRLIPTGFCFDFVAQPNYASNVGMVSYLMDYLFLKSQKVLFLALIAQQIFHSYHSPKLLLPNYLKIKFYRHTTISIVSCIY